PALASGGGARFGLRRVRGSACRVGARSCGGVPERSVLDRALRGRAAGGREALHAPVGGIPPLALRRRSTRLRGPRGGFPALGGRDRAARYPRVAPPGGVLLG